MEQSQKMHAILNSLCQFAINRFMCMGSQAEKITDDGKIPIIVIFAMREHPKAAIVALHEENIWSPIYLTDNKRLNIQSVHVRYL